MKVIYLVRQARLISNPVDIETNDFENWCSLQAVEPIVHSRLENQYERTVRTIVDWIRFKPVRTRVTSLINSRFSCFWVNNKCRTYMFTYNVTEWLCRISHTCTV